MWKLCFPRGRGYTPPKNPESYVEKETQQRVHMRTVSHFPFFSLKMNKFKLTEIQETVKIVLKLQYYNCEITYHVPQLEMFASSLFPRCFFDLSFEIQVLLKPRNHPVLEQCNTF